MEERTVRDCRLLVVEDEYMLAEELTAALTEAGADVVGPVATVEEAVAIITAEPHIDGAILDVNLRGQMVFPAADILLRFGVPFVFTTGYDASAFPARFNHIIRCEKPASMKRVVQTVARAVHAL